MGAAVAMSLGSCTTSGSASGGGDPGLSNGSFQTIWDGRRGGASNEELRLATEPMSELRVGHYWATDPVPGFDYSNPGANVYNDSVYFDTSWSRV